MAEHDQNATIDRGTSVALQVSAEDEAGAPLDLTGKALHYRVAHSPNGASLLDIDRPTITSAAAVATIPLTAAETKALPAQSLYHELYMVEGADVTVLMTGRLTVRPAQAARHTPA